jgi:hypothetical protein
LLFYIKLNSLQKQGNLNLSKSIINSGGINNNNNNEAMFRYQKLISSILFLFIGAFFCGCLERFNIRIFENKEISHRTLERERDVFELVDLGLFLSSDPEGVSGSK